MPTSNTSKGPLTHPPGYKSTCTPMHCLQHPSNTHLQNPRVSDLCHRAALLQKGNALQACGRHDEARTAYLRALKILEADTRCARTDWERHSLLLNCGNTLLLQGSQKEAREYFAKAEAMGQEHVDEELGSTKDGRQMVAAAKVALARAFKIGGDLEGAKRIVGELVKERQKAKEEEAREEAKPMRA